MAGKDGNNCGFTAAGIFLTSEQCWVSDWIFATALYSLLSEEMIRRKQLCITGGDRQVYESLHSEQAKRDGWMGLDVFYD